MGVEWLTGMFRAGASAATGASTKALGARAGSDLSSEFATWAGRTGSPALVTAESKAGFWAARQNPMKLAQTVGNLPHTIDTAAEFLTHASTVLPHSAGAMAAVLAGAMTGTQFIRSRAVISPFLALSNSAFKA